jgi:hypothetical protein
VNRVEGEIPRLGSILGERAQGLGPISKERDVRTRPAISGWEDASMPGKITPGLRLLGPVVMLASLVELSGCAWGPVKTGLPRVDRTFQKIHDAGYCRTPYEGKGKFTSPNGRSMSR